MLAASFTHRYVPAFLYNRKPRRPRGAAMSKPMFQGSITALVTPFKNGGIDESSFQSFVEWQISQGSDGLAPCGTTGESPTLSHAEHNRVVSLCVEAAAGRVPVIAGAGSNSTSEAIELVSHAKKAGADAALVVTPYYNKPSQEGLFQHYKAITEAVDLPVIIYNIPGRCVIDMSVETMARLAALPGIVGVKDATADLLRPSRTRAAIGTDFIQLSGEDGTAAAFLAQGGVGCISVAANVVPRLSADLQKAWVAGDLAEMSRIQQRLSALNDVLFVETNPTPVKCALGMMGKMSSEVRLPLVQPSQTNQQKIRSVLQDLGLLSQ
jgi:4-hydroxy-tetrahydrodipicolinate synthase